MGAAATEAVTLRVLVPAESGKPGANELAIDVKAEDDPALKVHEKTTFLFPR